MTTIEVRNMILKEASIVEVVRKFVPLKKRGDEWEALCPFHKEKTPSFKVNDKKGVYKCFGCGKGGDVIDFVQSHQGIGFVEAIHAISEIEKLPYVIEQPKTTEYDRIGSAKEVEVKTVEKDILIRTLNHYDKNVLFQALARHIPQDKLLSLFINCYYIGTAKDGGTIFWQVDQFQRVRTASLIRYRENAKRIKEIEPVRLFTQSKGYSSCFFGEHLLLEMKEGDFVGIVESEKTAILCTYFLHTLDGRRVHWLASSGKNGLTEEKLYALAGLPIILCPDSSFDSRAVWGAVPMRKKMTMCSDGKERMKIDKDGEVQEDYISIAQKLLRYRCTVDVYNPFPEIEDGSDIGDFLLKADALIYDAPEWDELALSEPDWENLIL